MLTFATRLKIAGIRTSQVRRYPSHTEFIAAIQMLQRKQLWYSWRKVGSSYFIKTQGMVQ